MQRTLTSPHAHTRTGAIPSHRCAEPRPSQQAPDLGQQGSPLSQSKLLLSLSSPGRPCSAMVRQVRIKRAAGMAGGWKGDGRAGRGGPIVRAQSSPGARLCLPTRTANPLPSPRAGLDWRLDGRRVSDESDDPTLAAPPGPALHCDLGHGTVCPGRPAGAQGPRRPGRGEAKRRPDGGNMPRSSPIVLRRLPGVAGRLAGRRTQHSVRRSPAGVEEELFNRDPRDLPGHDRGLATV